MNALPNLEIERPGDHLLLIRIARPAVLNAVDAATLEGLRQAIAQAESDPDCRVLILTGQGDKAFIAGSDISALARMSPADAEAFSRLGQAVSEALARFPRPTIAMVNGYALGSGAEFAMACDLIIAGDRAAFGLPEVGLGVIPGHGGTARLADWVGSAKARELIFSGRRVKADEAERIGLANRVVPHDQLLTQTLELAKTIAGQSPTAVAAAKRALRAQRQAATDQAMASETSEFAALFGTPDQAEGMRAFAEKRAPRFGGN